MAGPSATYTIRGRDKTKKTFQSVKSGLKSVSKSVFNMKSAVVSLAGVGGFGLLIGNAIKAGDALAKTSDKLGIATEKLQGLRHAAKLSGVETRTMDMALQRMTRRVSEAAQGTGEARGALEELGISAQRLAAMSPDQQFIELSKAMAEVTNQGDRVRLAMRLFDSEGVALVNTMALGAEGIRAASQEIEDLGVALNRVEAAKLEAASDAMMRAGLVFKGVFQQIAVNLAPWITELATRFADLSKRTGGFKEVVDATFRAVITFVARTADVVTSLQEAWSSAGLAFEKFKKFHLEGLTAVLNAYVKIRQFFEEDFEPPKFITNLNAQVVVASKNIEALQMRLQELAERAPLSEGLQELFDSIIAKSNETAEVVAANAVKFTMPIAPEVIDERIQQQQEMETLVRNHLKRMHNMERNAQARSIALWRSGWQGRFQITSGILKNLGGLMQSENRKQFEFGKKAAIADTLINTYSMAVKAYQALAGIPIVGPALGIAAAVAATAYGKAQVDAIRSQQFGGGATGATPYTPVNTASVGGGAPAGVATPVTENALPATAGPVAPTRVFNITLVGPSHDANEVRDLMMAINEEIGNDVHMNTRIEL